MFHNALECVILHIKDAAWAGGKISENKDIQELWILVLPE